MRKKVFFTGTLLVLMLVLAASTTAFAETLSISNDEARSIKSELKEGKPVKDVLERHNITMGQIRSALTQNGGFENGNRKLSNTQIAAIAVRLGLNPETVQAQIEAGKTLQEILKENNITQQQIKESVMSERKIDSQKDKRPFFKKWFNKKHQ